MSRRHVIRSALRVLEEGKEGARCSFASQREARGSDSRYATPLNLGARARRRVASPTPAASTSASRGGTIHLTPSCLHQNRRSAASPASPAPPSSSCSSPSFSLIPSYARPLRACPRLRLLLDSLTPPFLPLYPLPVTFSSALSLSHPLRLFLPFSRVRSANAILRRCSERLDF